MSVDLEGRYEARDHGLDQPWQPGLVLDDGAWHDLGPRPDDERRAWVGRRVTVRGGAIHPVDALRRIDPLPLEATGPRADVEVVEVALEMARDQAPAPVPPPPGAAAAAIRCSVRFYRYLYDAVGATWHWWDRKRWSDARLAARLADAKVEVRLATEHGTPVGFAELDRTEGASCELAYFGLVPEALGRGLGRWFLADVIAAAWADPALARLWVHTCSLDGPAALHTYRRLGFVAFRHDRFYQAILAGDPRS